MALQGRPSAIVLVAVACLAGCGAPADDLGGRLDRSLAAAMHALIHAQSPDGAWRSPTYGVFRDGLALTPSVLKAVAFGPDVEGAGRARHRGVAYLAGRVRSDGSIDPGPFGLTYPVYTASVAVVVLGRIEVADGRRARDAWLRELRRRQLTEDLGWDPSDPAYGAWGYAIEPPTKRETDPGLGRAIDADLSSTLFAVGALRLVGIDPSDPSIRKALAFVQRCQNLPGDGHEPDPAFDDGGFFFSPTDPVRNKAGVTGKDRGGRTRYHSYGSTTADGLRALMRCGLPPDHPRVVAAREWLEHHFSAATNPGVFEPIREDERDATYYYYAWSVAHAFRALDLRKLRTIGHEVDWTAALSEELLRRQRNDGTWANRFTAAKEDDPLIATSFAAAALGISRAMLGPGR
jgi:squalene-hopene/tetraprenyl-beta-curcumene cyclase